MREKIWLRESKGLEETFGRKVTKMRGKDKESLYRRYVRKGVLSSVFGEREKILIRERKLVLERDK